MNHIKIKKVFLRRLLDEKISPFLLFAFCFFHLLFTTFLVIDDQKKWEVKKIEKGEGNISLKILFSRLWNL